jgi:hypothetical protein
MSVAFTNNQNKGFVLKIDLNTAKGCTVDVVEFKDQAPKESATFAINETHTSMALVDKKVQWCKSQLILENHMVIAFVERSVVFEQELYEVKVCVSSF